MEPSGSQDPEETSQEEPGLASEQENTGEAGMVRPSKSGGGGGNGGGGGGTESQFPAIEDNHPAKKTLRVTSPPNRTKSNQRWMKLRTTVQISGAIQKNKAQLKREDSFLKRFSTRQIPEPQETLDTGDDEDGDSEMTSNGTISGEKKHRKKKKRRKRPPASVINPDGCFFYYWLFLITVCVLYNFWILIARHSFPELQDRYDRFWLTCDIFTDVVFILDIVVQFRTGYLEQGLMVYDSKKLAGHYMESNSFLLDLITVFPLDLLQLNLGVKPLLRFPRFFKVHRVYHYYYIVEARTVYPNVLRVVNLIHILLILAHWFGCFYYLLSEAEGFQGDWVYPYRPGEYATLSRKYLASLYWSTLTLTTIGDLPTPETNADKGADSHYRIPSRGHKSRLLQFHSSWGYIFTIVGYLIGVFIFATIVGQVGNVITNRNANRLEFERLLDGAKSYMRHHKVPGGMKRRVLRWYDYSWSRGRIQGGGDIHSALGLLPDKLKTELALHVNLSVLKKVTIFQECQPEFLHDLVLKMRAFIFTPGDLICRKGEVAREMFIIADGVLEVISESGRVLTKMRAGDFFGEIGILNLDGLNKRTADVRSVGYSELFSLSREDVLAAMKDYPEAQEILQDLGRRRLREAQNMNRAWKNSVKRRERKISMPVVKPELPSPPPPNLRIVEKIKSDVKGFKDVFKLGSRAKRKKQEDVELLPLTKQKEVSASKGRLKRMPRVNDEASYEEEKPPSPPVIGAGLPLLQRLKLLKEKQDQEAMQMNKESSVSVGEGTVEKPEPAPPAAMSLLQRTLMLKQKEDKDKDPPETTTATPSVRKGFASTVRTQFQLPSQRIMKLRKKDPGPFSKTQSGLVSSSGPTAKEKTASGDKTYEPSKTESTESDQLPKCDESWMMLKKAVTQPYSLEDSFFSKSQDESSKSEGLDSGDSNADESVSKGLSQSAQDNNNAQNVDSDPSRNKDKTKIYRSIEDLSPEYGGLPFVKKLEILNERQKLTKTSRSHSENSKSSDSTRLGDSFSSSCDPTTPTQKETIESNSNEVVLRKASSLDEKETEGRKEENRLSQQLSSPESNETVERRNLKSILKKLSSGSLIPGGLGSSEETDNSASQSSSFSDIKKLMRAQTIEGYAARHSKLTKSVTFNRVALHSSSSGSLTPTSNGVFLPPESFEASNQSSTEVFLDTHQTLDNNGSVSTERTSESIVLSASEIKTVKTPTHSLASSSGEAPGGRGVENPSLYTAEFSMPALIIEHTSNHSYSSVDAQRKQAPMPYIGDLFGQIREIVEGHLDAIECKYVDFFQNLEVEVRKRDSTISNLQSRIQELECNSGTDGKANSETSFDYGDHPFLRAGSADTILPASENLLDDTDQDDSDMHSRFSSDNYSIDDCHSEDSVEPFETPKKDYVSVEVGSSETSTESESDNDEDGNEKDGDDDDDDEGDDIVGDDDDVDEEMRSKYHYDWEVQMLAEELEKRKSGRKRAVSFDASRGSNLLNLRRSSYDQHAHEIKKPMQLPSTRSLEIQRGQIGSIVPRRRSLSINSMQKRVSSGLASGFRNIRNNFYRSSGEEPLICDLSTTPTLGSSVGGAAAIDVSVITPINTVSISATTTSIRTGVPTSSLTPTGRILSTSVSLVPSTICLKPEPTAFSSTPNVTCSTTTATPASSRARIHSCPVDSPSKSGDTPSVLAVVPSTTSAISLTSNDSQIIENVNSPPVSECSSPGVFPSSPDILSPLAGLAPSSTSKK